MIRIKHAVWMFVALAATPLPAQLEEDPREKMQAILDKVAEEMTQIDRWLEESSRSKAAATKMKENVERLGKLLDSVGESQQRVVKGIDDLLKEAQKMKGQSGDKQDPFQLQKQKQGQQQQQRGEQDQQRQQRPQQRQAKKEQPDQQQGKEERNEKDKKDKGKNVASDAPKKDPTDKSGAKKVQGAWGELPDYVLKHGRGTAPEVPDKYRKYLEAMTKDGAKGGAEKK